MIDRPVSRRLRILAFDPSLSTRLETATINQITVEVPWEADLAPGPIGEYIEVVDADPASGACYQPVDLNALALVAQDGLAPSESNPQFHQQMVYAVIMDTIRRFETALGRQISWRPDHGSKTDPWHGLLRVFPHAMQEANAYYDPEQRALLFGYFRATEGNAGTNLPGQVVFTCLSHDIIVHETTHAILDGIRGYFAEPTSSDAAAFHEGFADIVALLQHFSFKNTLLDTIQRTGGFIHRRQLTPDAAPEADGALIQAEIGEDNPIVDLARQFGEAMGHRKALRSALGTRQDPSALGRTHEAHERGAILVAAVFDAFFSCYIHRTRDLIRMVHSDGRGIVPNFLHADLANRLAEEAAKTAINIQNICLRALDYCPPVDITFGDYLRALVTADRDTVAEDGNGYRAALVNAFRARGIYPEGVISYSDDALSWKRYRGTHSSDVNLGKLWQLLNKYEDNPNDKVTRSELYEGLWAKAKLFCEELGLASQLKPKPESLHPLQRIRPDGMLERRIVAQIVQTKEMPLVEGDPTSPKFKFRGGATLLIERSGELQYTIVKPIEGPEGERRLKRQRDYLQRLASSFPLAPHISFDVQRDVAFCGIHRGY